jgi:hypothetical protein
MAQRGHTITQHLHIFRRALFRMYVAAAFKMPDSRAFRPLFSARFNAFLCVSFFNFARNQTNGKEKASLKWRRVVRIFFEELV